MSKPKLITGSSYGDNSAEPTKDSFDKIQVALDQIYESDTRFGSSISFNMPSGSFYNSPDDPYIDTIPINIIDSGENSLGYNNDSKNGNIAGVWFKTSNSAVGYSGFSNQILKSGELISGEVCIVWLCYDKSNGIIIQSIQSFSPAYVLNVRPVITLIGASNINTEIGQAYSDSGATATDTEDGDITSNLVIVNNVDINTLGTYQVTFNVEDSSGSNALEVVRTVNVTSGGGSSGTPPEAPSLTQTEEIFTPGSSNPPQAPSLVQTEETF